MSRPARLGQGRPDSLLLQSKRKSAASSASRPRQQNRPCVTQPRALPERELENFVFGYVHFLMQGNPVPKRERQEKAPALACRASFPAMSVSRLMVGRCARLPRYPLLPPLRRPAATCITFSSGVLEVVLHEAAAPRYGSLVLRAAAACRIPISYRIESLRLQLDAIPNMRRVIVTVRTPLSLATRACCRAIAAAGLF